MNQAASQIRSCLFLGLFIGTVLDGASSLVSDAFQLLVLARHRVSFAVFLIECNAGPWDPVPLAKYRGDRRTLN
jgi:hypothetical protein